MARARQNRCMDRLRNLLPHNGNFAVLLACLATMGCTAPAPDTPPELSFSDQVKAVKQGERTAIHVQAGAVTDAELELLRGATTLTELQLESGKVTDAGLETLRDCPAIELLKLRHSPIGDSGMKTIGACQQLRVLNLPHAQFSDQGLAELKSLSHLELLRFHSPHVTDDGLKTLAEASLPLRFLHLIDVPVTDAGLEHLIGITSLESLYIDGGQLSREAIERLYTARPELHIHFNQQHLDIDPQRHEH